MAITLISTAGAQDANSYLSVAEADAYLEAHTDSQAWLDLGDEDKKRQLISATRKLDLLIYAGRKSTQAQALQWPRIGIYDRDGYSVWGVPQRLKDATCELVAHWLTEEDNLAGDFELENLESVEIGPIKYTVRDGVYSDLPGNVKDRINSIGPSVILGGADSGPTSKVMVL